MYFAVRAFAALIVVVVLSCVGLAQEPAASLSPQSAAGANVAATKPAPDPPTDFWTQETMTGDWGGTRSRWKEKGIDLEFRLSNFVQGVASGGDGSNETEYTGKFEMEWKFDLGKVAGWKYWSSEIKTEFRFSGPLLLSTGAPWLRLTGDIQIIRDTRPRFDTAVVPGARLVMIF